MIRSLIRLSVLSLASVCAFSTPTYAEDDQNAELLQADAGISIWSRSFRYTDTAAQLFPREGYGQPSNFTVPSAPALRLGLSSYPGVLLGDSWLSYVGLFTRLNLGFATKTPVATDSGNISARNEYFNLLAGLQGRIPVGGFQFEPSFAFGNDSSSLEGICLLYTSPSPRDKRQSRMPSSA